MKITDLNYSITSDVKTYFQKRMSDIQDCSSWSSESCENLRYINDNGEDYISIGKSYLPPFLSENATIESVVEYCNNNATSENPIDLLQMIKEHKCFNEIERYPLTDFALNDLIDRAKVGSRFKDRAFFDRNIATFNDALWTAGKTDEGVKIYKINDVVFAIPSENYKPLPIATLIQTMETELNKLFNEVKFSSGFYCHEIMYVDYAISDKNVIRAYEKALNQVFYKPRLIIRLVTSNLGFSGANLYPMLEYSTTPTSGAVKISLGENISLAHKGIASLAAFEKNVNSLFSLVETIPEKLNQLNNIRVEHPVHCLINLADKCGVPAKYVSDVADTAAAIFNGTPTNARQIYMLMSKIIAKGKNEKEKLRLAEKTGKAIRILLNNVSEVDITKIKWISLSNIIADEGQNPFVNNTNDSNADVSSMEQLSFQVSA